MENNKDSWFKRHKVLLGFLGGFFSLLILFVIIGITTEKSNEIQKEVSITGEATKEVPKTQETIAEEPKVEETQTEEIYRKENVEGTWHKVKIFEGTDDQTIQFTTQGNPFKVTYKYDVVDDRYSSFNFWVYKINKDFPANDYRHRVSVYHTPFDLNSRLGNMIIEYSPGDYELEISAYNLYKWKIQIDDYY